MIQCNACDEIVQNINGQCFCGKTSTDHKGRASGENYSKTDVERFPEKPKLSTCPHCGWKGMVVPKYNIGCPEHGLWYKNTEEEHNIIGDTEDEHRQDICGDGDSRHARANRREESRRRKERQILRRPNRKRQHRHIKV